MNDIQKYFEIKCKKCGSTDVDVRTSFLQFNALVELSNELETIYQQNIKMADYYNKFFK